MPVPSLLGTLFSAPPKSLIIFWKSLSILPQATVHMYTAGHFAIIAGKFWSLCIFRMLAAVRRENTQLMHCTCLGRTPQRSSSLLDPPEKLCLWSCCILCALVASFFRFCIFHRNRQPLLFLSLCHKTKAKPLVRKYLHKTLSRHKFLVLTVSLCLPVVFGYKAQDMAEGEPVLREKKLFQIQNRTSRGRGFNSKCHVGHVIALLIPHTSPWITSYSCLKRNMARQS